jgi:hypothetical protein
VTLARKIQTRHELRDAGKKQVLRRRLFFLSGNLLVCRRPANGRRGIEGSISMSLSLANTLVKDDVNTRKKAALDQSKTYDSPFKKRP